MDRVGLQINILVKQAKKGDKQAFGKLYEAYFTSIVHYIARRVPDFGGAEDLAEEVFLKAWLSLEGLKKNDSFVPWLYLIARNLLYDFYRKNGRSPEQVSIDEVEYLHADVLGPDTLLEHREESEKVLSALKQLPNEYKDVLEMKFLQGLSNIEIAEVLHKRVGNVRVLQLRALKKMKEILEENA